MQMHLKVSSLSTSSCQDGELCSNQEVTETKKNLLSGQHCTRPSTASRRAPDKSQVWFYLLLLPLQPQLFDSPAAAQCPKAINHLAAFGDMPVAGRYFRVLTGFSESLPLAGWHHLYLQPADLHPDVPLGWAQGCRVWSPAGCPLNAWYLGVPLQHLPDPPPMMNGNRNPVEMNRSENQCERETGFVVWNGIPALLLAWSIDFPWSQQSELIRII